MTRFDDLNRSERYFTATLLPAILFDGGLGGVRQFAALVDRKAAATDTEATEYDAAGLLKPRPPGMRRSFEDLEILTEFHVARDLGFAGVPLASGTPGLQDGSAERERRDAPDIVLVLGNELIVCEAKFYSAWNVVGLESQLRSQRRQIRYLFQARPGLRAYMHIALVPEAIDQQLDCNAVLTWDDVATLADSVLGPDHYVTARLHAAVARYAGSNGDPGIQNWDGKLGLHQMLEKCRQLGDSIQVGHFAGERDLQTQSPAYLNAKLWKWRDPRTNSGTAVVGNWIAGSRFAAIVGRRTAGNGGDPGVLGAGAVRRTSLAGPPRGVKNFDGKLPLPQMLAMCRSKGDLIEVGHTGGEDDLRRRGSSYARTKPWKWRDPSSNAGIAEQRNWIPGTRFVRLIESLEAGM